MCTYIHRYAQPHTKRTVTTSQPRFSLFYLFTFLLLLLLFIFPSAWSMTGPGIAIDLFFFIRFFFFFVFLHALAIPRPRNIQLVSDDKYYSWTIQGKKFVLFFCEGEKYVFRFPRFKNAFFIDTGSPRRPVPHQYRRVFCDGLL